MVRQSETIVCRGQRQGIFQKKISNIFLMPFTVGKNVRDIKGTGLELSIVQRICQIASRNHQRRKRSKPGNDFHHCISLRSVIRNQYWNSSLYEYMILEKKKDTFRSANERLLHGFAVTTSCRGSAWCKRLFALCSSIKRLRPKAVVNQNTE